MVIALDDIPVGCEPATNGLEDFESQARLPPADLVAYFRENPQAANRVLQPSSDKRYTPYIHRGDRDRLSRRLVRSWPQVSATLHGLLSGSRRLFAVFIQQRQIAMPNHLTNRWPMY